MVEEYKLAALSTAHLTEDTAKALTAGAGSKEVDEPLVAVFEYGYFVSCLIGGPSRYADLEVVRKWARENGYGYVLIDRDASTVDGLDTYDW